MRHRFIGTLAAMAMILAITAPVAADAPNDCPDPAAGDFADESTGPAETGQFTIDGTTVYYAVTNDGHTISFFSDVERTEPIAVELCVKGGSVENSGVVTASTYTVDFDNSGGQTPQISNFVVYSVPQLTPTTAAAASVAPPSCTAAGTLVVPADTASVMYTVSPAYSAGATGTFTVTATAKAGFALTGTSQWTVTVAAKVTGAVCVTGGGTLPGNPVRGGTLGSTLPNTAMDAPLNDAMPTMLVTVLALAGLAYVGHRNLRAIGSRR